MKRERKEEIKRERIHRKHEKVSRKLFQEKVTRKGYLVYIITHK